MKVIKTKAAKNSLEIFIRAYCSMITVVNFDIIEQQFNNVLEELKKQNGYNRGAYSYRVQRINPFVINTPRRQIVIMAIHAKTYKEHIVYGFEENV
jgi:hypothetical protein